MTEAHINPLTLKAARKRAGLDVAGLAEKLTVAHAADKVRAWEAGTARPTFPQARTLASVLRVPFAALFLEPGTLGSQDLPDLRTTGGRGRAFSVDLCEVYRDALRKQAWVREVREHEGVSKVVFVGAWRRATPAHGARAIERLLGLSDGDRAQCATPDEFLRLLVRRAEDAGILVLRSATVGSNNHRPLDVEEFRGFAIADDVAPLVFVNTADAKAAQVFTLIHEIAHLWRAETGISQPSLEMARALATDAEAFCDAVAAELLVPQKQLEAQWNTNGDLSNNCDELRRRFKVSGMVIARRAFDLGLVKKTEYRAFMAEQMRLARAKARGTGGPEFTTMVRLKNGSVVTDMVTRAVRGGELLWREASQLLGVTPRIVAQLVEQQSGST
ncbi:MAG: ImmA/IrrE family metallo-endopeptidase [Deltaproteobacteria bacterium]|nr:ImmA/IrrE family metallo-endopeptidase [Deltaproteobacteria bacterium]